MSIFMKVTGKTLAKNRTRTLVTIVGIILSTAMLTAVASIVSSFLAFYRMEIAERSGEWYINSFSVLAADEERLLADPRTKTVYTGYELGYAPVENYNPHKPYLFLMGADGAFMQNMGVRLVEGRLPESENEILLPMHLLTNQETRSHVGDVLTLTVGERYLNGVRLNQCSYFFSEEDYLENPELEQRTGREEFVPSGAPLTLTVVGIYERPDWEEYSAAGYTALTFRTKAEENVPRTVFFTTKNAKDALDWTMDGWDYAQEGNTDLLMADGASSHRSFYTVLYGMAAILVILILFGSVSLIYNAFSISVSDRTRQFGLLSSVGATRQQLRHAVFCEAVIVGGIGVPLGILAGLGGIAVTIGIIGQKLNPLLTGEGSRSILTLKVDWQTILVSAVLGFGTVLISAWIPAVRATRISPIEAIRANRDVRAEKKPAKVSGFIRRLFGLSGILSRKYYSRDKKHYRATILSIIMSVVLFVAASSLTGYLTRSIGRLIADYGFEYSLQISPYSEKADTELTKLLFRQMLETEGVKNGSWSQYYSIQLKNVGEYISREAEPFVYDDSVSGLILFLDDDTFRGYVQAAGEDPSRYFREGAPLAVLSGSNTMMEGDVYTTRYFFDRAPENVNLSISYPSQSDSSEETLSVPVGLVQKELPSSVKGYYQMGAFVVLPVSQAGAVLGEDGVPMGTVLMFFNSDGSHRISEGISGIIADNGLSDDVYVHDVRAEEESVRNILFVVRLLTGGFIVLITLIAVANVFNTIYTNIRLRRRDFAMLRSVGMTHKGIVRMMTDECLIYGTRALALGIPLSLLFSFAMYKVMSSGLSTSFILPWQAILISVASVFVIVFVSMMFAWRELERENLVEAIRSDIQ